MLGVIALVFIGWTAFSLLFGRITTHKAGTHLVKLAFVLCFAPLLFLLIAAFLLRLMLWPFMH